MTKKCRICGWEIKNPISGQRICTKKNGRPTPSKYIGKESACQRKAENKRRKETAERKKNKIPEKNCLKCNQFFQPLSKFNRICTECKQLTHNSSVAIGEAIRTIKYSRIRKQVSRSPNVLDRTV